MIEVKNLNKEYRIGKNRISVLKNLSFVVKDAEKVAIIGPSGSGKSTLLNIMSGVDKATSGEVRFNNMNICAMNTADSDRLRLTHFGFIFQSYHLIPTLTAKENIALPFAAKKEPLDRKRVEEICSYLDISSRLNHFPHQLSGGERQRVAIARAVAPGPDVIFSDEATGNLDAENSELVMKLLVDVCEKYKTTLIYVTHDMSLTHYAESIIDLGKMQDLGGKNAT